MGLLPSVLISTLDPGNDHSQQLHCTLKKAEKMADVRFIQHHGKTQVLLVLDGELFSLELQVQNIGLIDWERHNDVLPGNRIWRDQKDCLLTSL